MRDALFQAAADDLRRIQMRNTSWFPSAAGEGLAVERSGARRPRQSATATQTKSIRGMATSFIWAPRYLWHVRFLSPA